MAKAKQAPNLDSSSDLYDWASEVLMLRFDEVTSFGEAVLVPWNVNAVHDMRVALRRLRSALRDFADIIDGKSFRRIKVDLKRVADALGQVRDRDVAVISLEGMAGQSPDETVGAGLKSLINDLRIARERSYIRMRRTLDAVSLTKLQTRFLRRISESLSQQELFRPSSMSDVARRIIDSRIDDVIDLGPQIYLPFDRSKLHELRMATKRLRYAIEIFSPCWQGELDGFAKEMARLQSYLGDVHDYDLWIEDVSQRLTTEAAKESESSRAAAAWLLTLFVEKRGKEYSRAVRLWRQWVDKGLVQHFRAEIKKV